MIQFWNIRIHFYRPKITEDIYHFVKKICPLVEKKKPSQIQTTAMQGFTTRWNSEFVSMNLNCLNKIVADINTYPHRYAPLKTKKAKQQQSAYIISSSISEPQVKKKNSKITCYKQRQTYQNITTSPKVHLLDTTDE